MVTITRRTRISEVIKSNPASIEAIASVARPLEKLRNPLLRKIMASRVTLSEAAAIGGCDLRDLLAALAPLGFRYEHDMTENSKTESEGKPGWLLAIAPDKIQAIDVRPAIQSGADPLKTILEMFGAMRDGEVLCVINSFTPYPLINLLAKQSLAYVADSPQGEVYTWFLKRIRDDVPAPGPTNGGVHMDRNEVFEAAVARFEEKHIRRIDVRALPAPGPMRAILDELGSLPAGHALYVYHKKVPVYLLEEIRDRNLTVRILNQGDGEVRVLIHANDPLP